MFLTDEFLFTTGIANKTEKSLTNADGVTRGGPEFPTIHF